MDAWQPTIIKGNAGEIASLAKSTEVQSRGVDSVGAGFKDTAQVLKALAKKKREHERSSFSKEAVLSCCQAASSP